MANGLRMVLSFKLTTLECLTTKSKVVSKNSSLETALPTTMAPIPLLLALKKLLLNCKLLKLKFSNHSKINQLMLEEKFFSKLCFPMLMFKVFGSKIMSHSKFLTSLKFSLMTMSKHFTFVSLLLKMLAFTLSEPVIRSPNANLKSSPSMSSRWVFKIFA